jgi:hypothetical protein
VDDAVADGVRGDEAVDGLDILAVDQMELQARRACVDGQYGQVQLRTSG